MMREDKVSKEIINFRDDFPVLLRKFQGKREYLNVPYYHTAMEFHFFRCGNGNYFIRDSNYQLGINTVIISHKNEIHRYIPDPEPSVMTDTSLLFSTQLLRHRPSSCLALRGLENVHHLVLSNKQAVLVEFLLNNISDELDQKGLNWQQCIINQVETFLITLQRAADGQLVDRENKDPIIKDVIKYIDKRFSEDLSLSEVSDNFSMSSYSLCRKFKHYVGLGFKKYIIHRRILEAKKMLEETDMKVASIAYAIGFESISTFNRDFRILTGVTPADYRRYTNSNTDKS